MVTNSTKFLFAHCRKKIRSCNECFMQYMEMKRDIKTGGDVPQIEDDSEDESHNGDLPFIPMSSSSFSSGKVLCISLIYNICNYVYSTK